jgi:dehydrogenase/reductase SDR family member 7B
VDIFDQKTVLVTGASSGIGEAFCRQISSCQLLILVGRTHSKLQLLADSLSVPCKVLAVDINAVEFLDYLQNNQIDVLINNAGISQRSAIIDTDITVVNQLMQSNYFAVVGAINAVLSAMIKRESGRIITIGSMAGKMGSPKRAAYAASKHAVIGYMDCLRSEVFHLGIKVQTINPSFVKTNLSVNAFSGDGSQYAKIDKEIANGMLASDFVKRALVALNKETEEINVATGKAKWGHYLHRINANWYHKAVRKFYKRSI